MNGDDKNELQNEILKLKHEKDELTEDIRDLDWAKIIKLEKENEDLRKRVEWLDKDKKKTDREKENLFRQVSNSKQKRWFNTLKMIMIIGVIDLIVLPLLIIALKIHLSWIFMGIGIVTFLGILIIANYMSGTTPLNSGEIRKALTASVITVYLTFIPLITFGTVQISNQVAVRFIVGSFTWIVGIIIILYFVSRAVEDYAKIKHEK